jgi:preprotein translocase subunit YajC
MGLELLLPLMIIALIAMMFLQGSRQRKAMKALQEMQDSLAVGDRVLTTSGLHATVVTTGEETLVLEVAPGVRTQWDRRVIREKLDAGTAPGAADGAGAPGPRTEPTPE